MAEYTTTTLIRTAVVAQRFKTVSITLKNNVSRSTVNFTIGGVLMDESPVMVCVCVCVCVCVHVRALIIK